MHNSIRLAGVAGMLLLFGQSAQAGILGTERVASGLSSPMFVTHAPGDSTRLFIGERGGTIRILNMTTGMLEPTAFLSIPSVDQGGEGGLLGMAFHPDYETNGKFYVNVTFDNGGLVFENEVSPFSTHIQQYSVSANPNIANSAATPVLDFIQPQSNHNAGWIGFSPTNGYLYVPTGDGGGSNDRDGDGDHDGHTPPSESYTGGNAQDITDNFLGKILRVDVNSDAFPGDASRNYAIPATNPYVGETGDDEIWSYGLRNPFRGSFDRDTGGLWLGDVGQSAREEIDFQPADSEGGDNFGWRLREGLIANPTSGLGGDKPTNNVDPVYDYLRSGTFGGKTVIGGYVYRGPDSELQGQYFFADSGDFGNAASNKFWTFDTADVPMPPGDPEPTATDIKGLLTPDIGSPRYPVSFGEDAVGNLYIVYLETNEVYRIVTDMPLAGDYNDNGFVDAADYTTWRDAMTAGASTLTNRDPDNTGPVDEDDFLSWRDRFGESLNSGAGGGEAASAAVPEPASILMLVQLLCLLIAGAWYNRK